MAAAVQQVVITWGRGAEGQLGGSGRPDGSAPKVIDGSLKGRQILQVLTASGPLPYLQQLVARVELPSQHLSRTLSNLSSS